MNNLPLELKRIIWSYLEKKDCKKLLTVNTDWFQGLSELCFVHSDDIATPLSHIDIGDKDRVSIYTRNVTIVDLRNDRVNNELKRLGYELVDLARLKEVKSRVGVLEDKEKEAYGLLKEWVKHVYVDFETQGVEKMNNVAEIIEKKCVELGKLSIACDTVNNEKLTFLSSLEKLQMLNIQQTPDISGTLHLINNYFVNNLTALYISHSKYGALVATRIIPALNSLTLPNLQHLCINARVNVNTAGLDFTNLANLKTFQMNTSLGSRDDTHALPDSSLIKSLGLKCRYLENLLITCYYHQEILEQQVAREFGAEFILFPRLIVVSNFMGLGADGGTCAKQFVNKHCPLVKWNKQMMGCNHCGDSMVPRFSKFH